MATPEYVNDVKFFIDLAKEIYTHKIGGNPTPTEIIELAKLINERNKIHQKDK